MGKEETNATERGGASSAGFGPPWASLAAPPAPCAPRGAHGCRRHRALASSASGCGACGPRVWPAPQRPRAHDGVRRPRGGQRRIPAVPEEAEHRGHGGVVARPRVAACQRRSAFVTTVPARGPRGAASRRPSRVPTRVPPARSRSSLGTRSHGSRRARPGPAAPQHRLPGAAPRREPGARPPAPAPGARRGASGSERAARGVPAPGTWRRALWAAASIPAPARLSGPPAGSGRHGPRNATGCRTVSVCPAGRRRTGRASGR